MLRVEITREEFEKQFGFRLPDGVNHLICFARREDIILASLGDAADDYVETEFVFVEETLVGDRYLEVEELERMLRL